MTEPRNIQSGWDYACHLSGSSLGSQTGGEYINAVSSAIQELTSNMNSKVGFLSAPARLKGFVAEDWHAGTFNINAILRGSGNRSSIEGSNLHASVDVSTNFGSNYSLKYYASGKASAISQAKDVIQAYYEYLGKSKSETPLTFDEYIGKYGYSNDMTNLLQSVYRGQGRIIPQEQLDEAIKYLQGKIASESMKEGANRAAVLAKYQETLSMLSDRIKDGQGIESIPLTKEEAEAIAALCKEGNFKPEDFGLGIEKLVTPDFILQQALKAGYTAALLTIVLKIGPDICKAIIELIKEGEIDVNALSETGLNAISVGAEGFLRGSIASSITIACKSGKFGTILMDVEPSVVGAITFLVLDTIKNSILVASGKMTPREMGTILAKEILISSAAIAGGTIGQMVMPALPVLGYMLGSLVGSLVTSMTIFVGEKKVLAFCAETGFACFGLVEQDYQLKTEILAKLGYEIAELEQVELESVSYEPIEMEAVHTETLGIETKNDGRVEFKLLRRGIIGFNAIGYVY